MSDNNTINNPESENELDALENGGKQLEAAPVAETVLTPVEEAAPVADVPVENTEAIPPVEGTEV